MEDVVLSGRMSLYKFIAAKGRNGATDEELEEGLGMPGNSVRARRIELARAKAIKKLPARQRRLTRSGRKAAVWVATGYFIAPIDDTPQDEDEKRLYELRLVVNRKVAKMSEPEALVMAVLADCASLPSEEVGKSLLEALAPLGLSPDLDNDAKAAFILSVLVQWAFARQEAIEKQRDALWALLADVEALPGAFPKDSARAVAYAAVIAHKRLAVCDLPDDAVEAAAQWLAGCA